MEPQTSLNVKKITKDDYEAVAQLRHKLWPQDALASHLAEMAALYTQTYCGFIARDGDKVVGFIEISQRPYVNGCLYRPVAFIEGIYLLPSYDNDQARALLVTYCEAWAKSHEIQEIASDAYLENQKSQDELLRLNFQPTEKIVYFRKKL